MPPETVAALCNLEYLFVCLDTDMGDLAQRLQNIDADLPRLRSASERVSQLRYAMRAVLRNIDDDVTRAVRAAEEVEVGC